MRCCTLTFVLFCFAATVSAQPQIAACTAPQLTCNSHPSGRLENATCFSTNTADPYFIYHIDGTAGMMVDAFLQSNAFPQYLALYRGNSDSPLVWDDGNSIARVTYDIVSSDTYWLVAAGRGSVKAGASPSISTAISCA